MALVHRNLDEQMYGKHHVELARESLRQEAKSFASMLRSAASGKKPRSKDLDKQVEQAWYQFASGVQVDIMDIPKIFDEVKAEIAKGTDIETATKTVATKYRKN
jgi:hypothetical protein